MWRVDVQQRLFRFVRMHAACSSCCPRRRFGSSAAVALTTARFAYCRDVELAKFEAFLSKEGGSNVNAMVRGRQRLAYPIKK